VDAEIDSLVIGAGPAGLAAAACLRERGRPFAIVEQAACVGSTWRRHYDRLHLHTDRDHSALPYFDFPGGTARYPSRDQVVTYLDQYAEHFGLAPRFDTQVTSVRCADSGWITTTTAGLYRSRHVIVATGHNAVPHVPRWPGQEDFRGRIVHSSEYRNGAPFRDQRVLVVGLGNSGGEIAIDLLEHGAHVAIAVRNAVNVVPREIFGLPVSAIASALGRLPVQVADRLAAPLIRLTIGDIERLGLRKLPYGPITQLRQTGRVPLIDIGTIELIRGGRIELLDGLRSMSAADISFARGATCRFDAVVLATGFRPALERFLQIPASPPPGLHLCGFRISPVGMLHEIAAEAQRIAADIDRTST
jgi:indole-3-pyruvate monooxygenase